MNNTCPIRVTAAAGTNLAGTFLLFTIIIFKRNTELSVDFFSPTFLLYGGLLDRTFMHCPRFFTAAISSGNLF